MSAEGVAAAHQLLGSLAKGDVQSALTALHPENVLHAADSLWYRGDWTGPGGLVEMLGLLATKLDLEVKGYEVMDAGDATVMRADVVFISKASGRRLETSIAEIYRTRGDQIVDMDIFYKDTAAVIALAADTD